MGPLESFVLRCAGRLSVSLSCFIVMLLLMGVRTLGQITGAALEDAATAGKRGFMVSGTYSTVLPPERPWRDMAAAQTGIKLGLGVSDRVDVKFYYSRWAVRGSEYHRNVFQLITKVTGEQHMLALYLPFGLVHSRYKQAYSEEEIGKIWMITPRMIATLKRKKHFDLCIIPYLEILKEKSCETIITGGMNLGMGIDIIPRKLSFRIEGGVDVLSLLGGYAYGTMGMGLNLFLVEGK